MQYLRSTSLSVLLATTAVCQTNPFVVYPQDPERQTLTCTSFVGRPDGANAAEALLEINDSQFRGIGDANGFAYLFGIYHWVADERLSTTETYDLVVRKSDPAGGPDMAPGSEYLKITGLTTPPSTSAQRGTWIMSDGFGLNPALIVGTPWQPAYLMPQRFYVGVGLEAEPLWPASDGHALFRADMLAANTAPTVGENERVGAPSVTWAGLQAQPCVRTPWTYVLGPLVTSPNLHVGGTDPNSTRLGAPGASFGMNGLFPDVSGNPRSDGLTIRVTDNIAPNAWCFLGAALEFQVPPIYVPWNTYVPYTLIGYGHIGTLQSLPMTLDLAVLQNGVHEYVAALPGSIPTSLVGERFVFQAVVFDVGSLVAEWTNAQAVQF